MQFPASKAPWQSFPDLEHRKRKLDSDARAMNIKVETACHDFATCVSSLEQKISSLSSQSNKEQ